MGQSDEGWGSGSGATRNQDEDAWTLCKRKGLLRDLRLMEMPGRRLSSNV